MKRLLTILALCIHAALFAQDKIVIDSCGLDTDPRLNKYEAVYFNETEPGNFNFEGKAVAFRYGNSGKAELSKKAYFDRHGRPYFHSGKEVINQLVIFTPEEKLATGGLDAAIVSWSKTRIEGRNREKVVRRIRKSA